MDEVLLKEKTLQEIKEKLLNSDFIGAIKVKDGLFIGDELAAQDFEFAVTNKVTHIINCSGRQIWNFWEHLGIKYLTFNWFDHDNQVVLDSSDNNIDMIFNFIEEAHEKAESCLVHSVRGQNRAATALSAYLMKKYKWSLYKAIEFLNNRRPDLEIRASFIQQLSRFEKRLYEKLNGCQTENWTELASHPHLENEELIITNTFLNSQIRPFVNDAQIEFEKEELLPKVQWIDNNEDDKEKLVTNTNMVDLLEKDNIDWVNSHHKMDNLKESILKRVIHIHPKDYNFIVKDGNPSSVKQTTEIKLEDDSDEANLKGSSFEKTSKPKFFHY
jgi:hypothetical protein